MKIKIDLIYDSKLKSNVIGREIRTKTRFLTQDISWIDPIAWRIKDFHFVNLQTMVGIQESISPYSLNEISL